MKRLLPLLLSALLLQNALWLVAAGQSGTAAPDAAKPIQQSQSVVITLTNQDVLDLVQAKLTSDELIARIKSSAVDFDVSPAAIEVLKGAGTPAEVIELMARAPKAMPGSQPEIAAAPQPPEQIVIPAGTPIDIESSYTVSSLDFKRGDLLTFRVLVPVKVNDRIVIEKNAVVTARVVEAKRGGHWGHAGRLSWTMQDVVATDGTRIPIQSFLAKGEDRSGVKGTSHSAEVATKTIVMGVLLAPLFPIAPLALLQGFKRGENAVLPEGKRFLAFVGNNTSVTVNSKR